MVTPLACWLILIYEGFHSRTEVGYATSFKYNVKEDLILVFYILKMLTL